MAMSSWGFILPTLVAAMASFTAFVARCCDAVVDVVLEVVDAIADPGWLGLRRDTFALDAPSGAALPRALQQEMRHEAGVCRRSAARHI